MRRILFASLVALGVVVFVAGPALAACTQSDLSGNWRATAFGSTTRPSAPATFWVRCVLRLNAGGGVASGLTCRYDDGAVDTITGGSLTVSSACAVNGTVTTQSAGTVRIGAALDAGKTVMSGAGKNETFGDILTFTAVKVR